jgi:5-methyltetrahydrofolate--homocysteine methyltransferase
MTFREALKEQVIILDGGMGTQVQNLDLDDLDYGGESFKMLADILVFSHPDDVKGIHLNYYRAGAHAVETNTFGATPFRMSEYDFSQLDLSRFAAVPYGIDLKTIPHDEMAYYLSRRAGEIACEAREEYRQDPGYDGRPLFVVGSIGPSKPRVVEYRREPCAVDLGRHGGEFLPPSPWAHRRRRGRAVVRDTAGHPRGESGPCGRAARLARGERRCRSCARSRSTQFSKMQIFNTDIHAALVTCKGMASTRSASIAASVRT